MKPKGKSATLHALCPKSTGQPSVRVRARMMTAAQAAALNDDVLKKPRSSGARSRRARAREKRCVSPRRIQTVIMAGQIGLGIRMNL